MSPVTVTEIGPVDQSFYSILGFEISGVYTYIHVTVRSKKPLPHLSSLSIAKLLKLGQQTGVSTPFQALKFMALHLRTRVGETPHLLYLQPQLLKLNRRIGVSTPCQPLNFLDLGGVWI